jgi:hypothetical protein
MENTHYRPLSDTSGPSKPDLCTAAPKNGHPVPTQQLMDEVLWFVVFVPDAQHESPLAVKALYTVTE